MNELSLLKAALEPYLGPPGAFLLLLVAFFRLETYLRRQKVAWSTLKLELDSQGEKLTALAKRVEEIVSEKAAVKDLTDHRSDTQSEIESLCKRVAALEAKPARRR